jgi:hypothetical protein
VRGLPFTATELEDVFATAIDTVGPEGGDR